MMQMKKYLMTGLGALCVVASSYALAGKGPSPETVDGAKTISAEEAKVLWQQGAVFIDTRKTSDWEAGRVPGAVHVNVKKPQFNVDLIQDYVSFDQPVVSYCNAEKCHRAASGAKKLVGFGFKNVYYFRDGFPSWKNAGYPYE